MMSSAPLFRRVLGGFIEQTPISVRRLHDRRGRALYRGEVVVERGTGRRARCFAWMTGLPPAGSGPIEVEIVASDGHERWARRIGGRTMRSILWAPGFSWLLWELLGPVLFAYRLRVENGAIVWRVEKVRLLGVLPLPSRWFAGVEARESGGEGRYRFDVRAELPGIGLLVHYRGWLAVGADDADRNPH
ncbi:MAG: DUF4166 domain-containing protein [Lysobacteraceae bacterium]